MGAAQALATAVVGAGQSAFMIGEYINGARVVAAPTDFAPDPKVVVRTPAQRKRRLLAGAGFLWCTLAALGGTALDESSAGTAQWHDEAVCSLSRAAFTSPKTSRADEIFNGGGHQQYPARNRRAHCRALLVSG